MSTLKKLKSFIRKRINSTLSLVGLEVVRRGPNRDLKEFLPLEETVAAAKQAGMEIGDYIEKKYDYVGVNQETIDRLVNLGVFKEKIDRVCEIGPGSGRYLEKVVAICHPSHYEIYETSKDWAKWLVQTYKVTSRPTDGRTLAHTPSNSIDLVQAHKVFVCTSFLTTCHYLQEMARVVKDGGKIVFDIATEDCMDSATLKKWLNLKINLDPYPALFMKQFAIDFLSDRGCSFIGSFLVPMKPGKTECMAFVKDRSKLEVA
jgi:SAM-dependent methyltransferase